MTNRYPGNCEACGEHVAKGGGTIRKAGGRWKVKHTDCENAAKGTKIVHTRFYGEHGPTDVFQNANGRCIDAPCCGCCN
jgi:hypothetical protein